MRFRRSKEDEREVLRKLQEHFPDGSPAVKLRGLIICVRERYKRKGDDSTDAIAHRARIPLANVEAVIGGRFSDAAGWESIDSVLIALGASKAHINAALTLFDQMSNADRGNRNKGWRLLNRVDAAPFHRSHEGAQGVDVEDVSGKQPYDRRVPAAATIIAPSPPGERASALAAPHVPDADVAQDADVEGASTEQPYDGHVPTTDEEASKETSNRPNPMTATTPRQFVTELKKFRAAHGKRSYRDMAKSCERLNSELKAAGRDPVESRSHGAFSQMEKKTDNKLPKLESVRAYIMGAGGDLDDLQEWEEGWRLLSVKEAE